MALAEMSRAICNKMVGDFENLIGPVNAAKSAIQLAKSNMRNALSSIDFSLFDLTDIENEVNVLKDEAKELYPTGTLNDMETLKNLIDTCEYLEGAKPVSAIIGTTLGVFDELDSLIDAATIPVFGAVNIGSLINNILDGASLNLPGGNKISDILKKADKLINCLDSLCVSGDASYIAYLTEYTLEVESLYSDLGIIGDPTSEDYGKFDYQAVFDDVGMTVQDQLKFNTALDHVEGIKGTAQTSLNNSVASAKSLLKTGFFS